jgi:hypothetical protein
VIPGPSAELAPMLVDGERVHLAVKGMHDSVVFTNKRLIATNIQGLTGKKRDYSSLPYSKIQAWSIETAGRFDLDSELELWFSGLGKVHLDFKGQVDIRTIESSWATMAELLRLTGCTAAPVPS